MTVRQTARTTLDLIRRVLDIDGGAAEYMLDMYIQLRNGNEDINLRYGSTCDNCLTWSMTPQGTNFWSTVNRIDFTNRARDRAREEIEAEEGL